MRRWLRCALTLASLPYIRFHDLRHTYASVVVAQKTHPKRIAKSPPERPDLLVLTTGDA